MTEKILRSILRYTISFLILFLVVGPAAAFPPTPSGDGFGTSTDYAYTGKFDAGGGEFQIPNGTVASLPSSGIAAGDVFIVTDGSTDSDCSSGGGSTVNLCIYTGAAWTAAGDGTGGAGSGSVTTFEEQDAQEGDADIVSVDFGVGFDIQENPDTEINVNFDLVPSSGNATLVAEEDALQVKYDSTYFTEGTSGLTLAEDSITVSRFADEDWGDVSVSTNSVTLDDDVVGTAEMADADHGMISWSTGAATVEDFALNAAADAGDQDITSVDKLEGYDTGVYIDMGADGLVEVVSDTRVDITAPNLRLEVDDAAYLNIATADGGATTISQTSDGTDQITIGDGSDRVDIASDTWDVTNGAITGVAGLTLTTGNNLTIGTTQWNSNDSIDATKVADADLGDISASTGSWTIDDDVIDKANFADEDWGDMSVSTNSVTIDDDVIDKANFADEDWGDMSVSTNSVTLDDDVVGTAEMANADHGMVSWSAGAATVEDFALNANADAGDYDITSVDQLQGVDAQVYIDMGTDGYVDLEADTGIRFNGPVIFANEGELQLPSSDASPDSTGEIRHDSTVTGLETGALAWYDGDEVRYLVDLDTLPVDDDYVVSYDATNDIFYMKADADSGGAPLWENVQNPTADQTLTFDDGEETTFTSAQTAADQFNFIATGAFGDISIVKIDQNTGDATDGTMLEIATDDGDVDHMLIQYGASDYATIKQLDAGALTIDVTSDGTASVDVVDALTAGSVTSDAGVSGTTITASTGFALGDGDYIGITGNEIMTFNAAGSIAVTGATMDVDGAFSATTLDADTDFTVDGLVLTADTITNDATLTLDCDATNDSDIVFKVDDGGTDWSVTLDGSEGQVVIGDGDAFDHSIKFNSGTNQGTITWDDDPGTFDLDAGINVTGASTIGDGGTTNYAAISATGAITFAGSGGITLPTGTALADVAFSDLTAGDSYTNYGDADDDTIDELFEAIDTAIGGLGGDITDVGPGFATGAAFKDGTVSTGTQFLVWEGTTDDGVELIIAGPEDPTTSDSTLTLPEETGTFTLGPAGYGTDDILVKTDGTGNLTQATGIGVDDSNNITSVASLTMSGDLSIGADPADAGTGIRMSNASVIEFEDSENTGEVTALTVDASEAIIIGDANASALTLTPNTTISGTTALNGNVTVGNDLSITFAEGDTDPNDADIVLSASDGVLTIAASDGVNNESLTLDFDAASNDVAVGTGSEVAQIDFGTIGLETDSLDLSEGNITNAGEIAADLLDADGAALAIGDNDETIAIDSSDWNIDATGAMTGVSLDADGTGNSVSNIENADIKAAAAIDATKIADGTVTSAEFQYLGSVTSDIQTQINAKEGDLANEAGLYSALSDVSDFTQPSEDATITGDWTFDNDTQDTPVTIRADGAGGGAQVGLLITTDDDDSSNYDPFQIRDDSGTNNDLLFFIDHAGAVQTGSWQATDVALAHGGTGASLSDPGADRLMAWDDSETSVAFHTADSDDFEWSTTTFRLVGEIPHTDATQDISADWEWQDNTAISFGDGNDWEVVYDESGDDRMEWVHTAGAGADVYWDLNDNAADSTFTITNSDATYEANLVVEGSITSNSSGDSYLQLNNNTTISPSGNRLYFEGNEAKISENGSEETLVTAEDGATFTGATYDFTGATNLLLPSAADASGEIGLNTSTNALTWHDGAKVITIDTTPTTDNYVLKYDNASATFTLEADETGGTPSWNTVTDPTADQTVDHDAGEETAFTFTGNYTTGTQFLVQQLTGNPTGGVLFEARGADSDSVVARFGDGTNYWQVSTAGVLSNAGTATINAAAASDIQVGGAQVDYDDMAGSAVVASTGGLNIDEDVDIDFNASDEEMVITNSAEYGADGAQVTIDNSDADVGAQMYLLNLDYSADDGQANADYIIAQDSGGTVWVLGQDGDVTTTDGDYTTTNGTISAEQLTTTDDISVTDDVLLSDGSVVGITGNEVITFNAAGTINVTGASMDVDGAFTATTLASDGTVTATTNVVIGDAGI
jgi:hypothetical protein